MTCQRQYITVVSGLPRSGTSLMMQMLAAGGVPPLTDSIRPADESNPRGYFEFEPVKNLRSDRSWIAQAQGRAVKVIHLLIPELPTENGQQYRVIFMHRDIDEVLASQQAMLARIRPGAAPAALDQLRNAFSAQLARTEAFLRDRAATFTTLDIEHAELLNGPATAAERISAFLGGSLDVPEMITCVDSTLWRQRKPQS